MDILTEDRRTIQETVDFIEYYMVSKKSHPLYKTYIGSYMTFRKKVIVPWFDETFIYERDYSKKDEQSMINQILDYFNILKEIFDRQ